MNDRIHIFANSRTGITAMFPDFNEAKRAILEMPPKDWPTEVITYPPANIWDVSSMTGLNFAIDCMESNQ